MIDLHTHVLPEIDDGATSFEEAVAMCRRSATDGVTAIVATPHQRHPMWLNDDPDQLRELHEKLREAVADEIELHLGAEIRIDARLYKELESKERRLQSLAGSRYLLLEFARPGPPFGMDPGTVIHEVRLMGYVPVLAHPELIPWLAEEPEQLSEIEEAGALFQITGMSLTGEFGRRPLTNARRLMDENRVHFVASDCHGLETRPPGLRTVRDTIAERWGEERAETLLVTHPRAVLEDRPITDNVTPIVTGGSRDALSP